jgi:type II secretory pathway predicted ATPase ExeA
MSEIKNSLGFSALIAEPGLGKTTLLYHLLGQFRNGGRTAFLYQTQCNSRGLLRFLLHQLDVPSSETNDVVLLHEQFREFVLSEARAGRRVLVFIDEAQNLDEGVLETVRLLSNIESPELKLLHIVLAGQPLLAKKLFSSGLQQFLQRLSTINKLLPFTRDETKCYIDHRLRVAGYRGGPLFTAEAKEMIAAEAGGIPRRINNFCFRALSLGNELKRSTIDAAIVQHVLADLHFGNHGETAGTKSAPSNGRGSPSVPASVAAEPNHEPQPQPMERVKAHSKGPCLTTTRSDESVVSEGGSQNGQGSREITSPATTVCGMSAANIGHAEEPSAKAALAECDVTNLFRKTGGHKIWPASEQSENPDQSGAQTFTRPCPK